MRFRLVASCKSFSPGTTNKQTNKQQIERQLERVTEREREAGEEGDRERQAQANSFVCFRAQNQQPLHTLRRKTKPRHQGASPISTPAQPQLQQYQAAAIPSVPWHMGAPRRWHRTSMSPKTETKKLHTQIHISYSNL